LSYERVRLKPAINYFTRFPPVGKWVAQPAPKFPAAMPNNRR